MASLPAEAAPRQATARHAAQASILSYVTSARPAAQDASVRPPAADSQQCAAAQRAAAQPTQTAQRKHASKKNTSLADTAATHVDEDICVSANEEESDDEANSADRDFISDGEDDGSGLEQRLCDREMQEESGSDTEQLAEAIEAIGGKRRKRPIDADETVKKKERSKQRELLVLPERGRGDSRRSVAEYTDKEPFLLPCGNFITPWDKQQERCVLDFGNERGRLAEGAFRNAAHARWMNSDEHQGSFARRFCVPIDESYPLKRVSTDVPNTPLDPHKCLSNATSKVLQCIRTMHEQTELDMMEGKFYEKVFLGLQRTSRELRHAMDGGPNGGLQGCAVDVLWRVSYGEEVSNISDSTLRLLDILTMAKQGSKGDELFHMASTDRVQWFTKGKIGLTKVQCGVQTMRAYNFQDAMKRSTHCTVQDVDKRLTEKLWNHRLAQSSSQAWTWHGPRKTFEELNNNWLQLSELVHSRHQVNIPEMMGEDFKHEPQLNTDLNTMQIFLYKDILPAWDAQQKQMTTVSIEGIYLMATSPANDPLVFLRSIAENNPTANTLLADAFKHMRSVLGLETCTWDQLFGTDRAGAAEATSESRMVEGFFKFCHAKSLYNVQLGGMRMDVKNKAEMLAWQNYIQHVVEARKAHYRLLIQETLHDRANWREAHLPVLNNSTGLDFYHGQTYWQISYAHIDKEIEEYIAMFCLESCEAEMRARLKDWTRCHHESADGLGICVPEGEGWARNSGVWIKIRTDNSKSHDDEKQEKAKKSEDTFPRWTQPQQANRMVKLWLSNAKDRVCGQDPLDVFLTNDTWIPDVEWLKHVMPTIDEQHEGVQWLHEMIGEYTMGGVSRLANVNPRMLEIQQLVGKEKNSMHKSVASVQESCRVPVLFRTMMQKINTSIKNALVQMQSCELQQWKLAALCINDLKKQNILIDRWAETSKPLHELEQNLQKSEDWMDLLCSSTMSSVYFQHSMDLLDADLSYMNQLFMWNFICCTMAHNECRRGCYGMSMRIIDMAGTVDILKEGDGKMMNKTQVVKVTEKSPGAGADTTVSFVMQMFVVAMSHISQTQEVRELACTARDTMHKQVSKMMYALFQGSGILMNSKGEFLNTLFQKELSNNGHMTELFKNDEDQLAWIEALMAHSGDVMPGAEGGVAQATWSTTMQLDHCHVERLKPIPVIVLTGNRPAQATPASAVEGGRWMHVASSTLDKDNGFFVVNDKSGAHAVWKPSVPSRVPLLSRHENTATNATSNAAKVGQKSSRARLSSNLSSEDVRKDIKIITRDDTQGNMLHFLLMQWLRKDAALLLSSLSHDAQSYTYSMKSVFSRLECAIGQIAQGMRRDFLDTNAQYWHRNAMGPWAKVQQVSMHVFFTMSSALHSSAARLHDGWPLDLHAAFLCGIRSLLTNSISFMATIASLHLWLSSAVLDPNFMLLSCYVYHFCGFQHMCSLRILALVLSGHKLNEDDFNAYVSFCEHIAPCVLERSVLAARSDHGPRSVCCGVLQTPSLNVLAEWSSWHVPSTGNELRTAHAARTQGPQSERLSVYCQPRTSFVHNESIKGFGRAKDGHVQQADPHVCGTSSRVLGSMLGMAQKPFEQHKRQEKGVCIDGVISSPTLLQPWENTVEFWKRARTGTLLPEASTATNDINKVRFEFVPYTGLWWDTAVHNAQKCPGIVKSFLLQSGVDDDISHHDFFTMLLRPYLEHKKRNDRVYGGPQAPGIHKNAWKMPVLDVSKPFEFCSRPHLDVQSQAVGVNVNVCMSLVHYVLVQGLGVTKDWNRKAHDNASFVSCVHMRNVSHMSLGLISLLLHTCCEKAMIPANSGHLLLPLPSPDFNAQSPARIEYDSRLHVDTSMHLMQGASDSVLAVDARLATADNWRLVNVNGASVLLYASVASSTLFPFPPEAVAHVACFFKYMALAHKRFVESKHDEQQRTADEHLFALAMLQLGASIRFEDMQHIQPSLTDCVVRDAREIPCVTCEHGFLFVLSFVKGSMHVRPVTPTLCWDTADDTVNAKSFTALPAEPSSLPACDFAKFFRQGLAVQPSAAADEPLRVSIDTGFSEHKRLPFYMFPVMHYPVLLRMVQNGWSLPVPEALQDDEDEHLFMHSSEQFFVNDSKAYVMRVVEQQRAWFVANCPEVLEAAHGLTELTAYFMSEDSGHVAGLWARHEGIRVHFDSLQQLQARMQQGIDSSLYAWVHVGSREYYMMEHELWGYAPVSLVSPQAERMLATFAWIYTENDTAIEQTKNVEFSFKDLTPNMNPPTKQDLHTCWGLSIEHQHSFLDDGCYTVSTVGTDPRGLACSSTQHVDFITVSRCIVPEGLELWIRVTERIYACLLQQAQEQGPSMMLPVSQKVHENMPAQHSRYLRAFYTLGGSLHDQPIELNQVRVICAMATRNCLPGRKATTDDHADAESRVNQNISAENTRFVAVCLPILLDGQPVLDYARDPALPFYKYLKEGARLR